MTEPFPYGLKKTVPMPVAEADARPRRQESDRAR